MYTYFCHSESLSILVTKSFISLEVLKVKVDIKEYEVWVMILNLRWEN